MATCSPLSVKDFLLSCELHAGMKLDMFCKMHSQVCCTVCASKNHSDCIDVRPISEISKQETANVHDLSLTLEAIMQQIEKLRNNGRSNIHFLHGSYNEEIQKLLEMRRKINTLLDELETSTAKDMNDGLISLQNLLESDLKKCTRLQDELKQLHEAIQSITDKDTVEFFIAWQKCLNTIKQSETFLKEKSNTADSASTFQFNMDIGQYLYKLTALAMRQSPDQIFSVANKTEYKVQPESDTRDSCNITGICVLPNGRILITDYKNRNVKMLNQTYHEISRWDFSFYPQDMCRVTDNEFAITCNLKDDSSHRHEVKFFSVTNDTIVEGNTMNLQHNCIGITHHRGELFVTSGTALHTYSMIGELVKTLYEDKTGHLTVLKCAVSHQGDIIFVTNFEQHKLLTLARDGSIISTFADPELKEPWDVHVTSAGHVLVCGWSSNNIVQVDSEGRTKLAVLALEGVENPESIYYNVNNHSIIVGQCKSNYIVVFNLK